VKRAELLGLLPAVFAETAEPGSPLDALLAVLEELHRPTEELLADLDGRFAPRRAPPTLLPLLALWVRLDGLLDDRGQLPTGSGRLRELLAAAPRLVRWRGTARGLVDFLETACGQRGFRVEESANDGAPLPPFHFVLHAPAAAAVHRDLVQRIVAAEKPAYVTYTLRFDPQV
jgi:phage tail-like protein